MSMHLIPNKRVMPPSHWFLFFRLILLQMDMKRGGRVNGWGNTNITVGFMNNVKLLIKIYNLWVIL
jgi:hypothetical protein